MGLKATPVPALRYRRPWYWLVVLVLAVLSATWLVLSDAHSRIAQNDRQFESSQRLRLQRMEQRIDDYFGDALQLAATGVETLAPQTGDRALTERLLLGLFRSRRNANVYGLGVFYAPYAFESTTRLFNVYDHLYGRLPADGKSTDVLSVYDHVIPGGADVVVFGSNQVGGSDDYTRNVWYRKSVSNDRIAAYSGPYWDDGRSFISTMRALHRNGKVIGVISVDTLTATFKSLMATALSPGDVGYIESSHRGVWLLGTARIPKSAPVRIDRILPLRYSGAFLHISTDASALYADDRALSSESVAVACALWILAGIIAFGLLRFWRSRETTLALEIERIGLETQIRIAKQVESELRKAAYTDPLTGLPNRSAFREKAGDIIASGDGTVRYAVYFIDLDRFNMINDTLGHPAGDELLKAIATRLRGAFDADALVCRFGGDEFVIVARAAPLEAGPIADRILECLREPILLGGHALYPTASIGIVLVEASYTGADELLRDADIAMYHAKRSGRARYAVFDTPMRRRVANESDLDNGLRSALKAHQLVPYYQPIVNVETLSIVSFEALVRWKRPGGDVVSATEFVEYAETHGLVSQIDESVLDDVCRDAAVLFERFPDTTVAVNISAAHLTSPGLASDIASVLRIHRVRAERIRLEITETAVMVNAEQARATLDQLRGNGVQIVLDDFGAGHSSLAYLHRLPIVGVKIDRSFVAPLATDPQAAAIVRSIVALAQTLGFYTVAEGVETLEQLEVLRKLGVLYAQGYLFSPALELNALLQFTVESSVG